MARILADASRRAARMPDATPRHGAGCRWSARTSPRSRPRPAPEPMHAGRGAGGVAAEARAGARRRCRDGVRRARRSGPRRTGCDRAAPTTRRPSARRRRRAEPATAPAAAAPHRPAAGSTGSAVRVGRSGGARAGGRHHADGVVTGASLTLEELCAASGLLAEEVAGLAELRARRVDRRGRHRDLRRGRPHRGQPGRVVPLLRDRAAPPAPLPQRGGPGGGPDRAGRHPAPAPAEPRVPPAGGGERPTQLAALGQSMRATLLRAGPPATPGRVTHGRDPALHFCHGPCAAPSRQGGPAVEHAGAPPPGDRGGGAHAADLHREPRGHGHRLRPAGRDHAPAADPRPHEGHARRARHRGRAGHHHRAAGVDLLRRAAPRARRASGRSSRAGRPTPSPSPCAPSPRSSCPTSSWSPRGSSWRSSPRTTRTTRPTSWWASSASSSTRCARRTSRGDGPRAGRSPSVACAGLVLAACSSSPTHAEATTTTTHRAHVLDDDLVDDHDARRPTTTTGGAASAACNHITATAGQGQGAAGTITGVITVTNTGTSPRARPTATRRWRCSRAAGRR